MSAAALSAQQDSHIAACVGTRRGLLIRWMMPVAGSRHSQKTAAELALLMLSITVVSLLACHPLVPGAGRGRPDDRLTHVTQEDWIAPQAPHPAQQCTFSAVLRFTTLCSVLRSLACARIWGCFATLAAIASWHAEDQPCRAARLPADRRQAAILVKEVLNLCWAGHAWARALYGQSGAPVMFSGSLAATHGLLASHPECASIAVI